MSLDNLSDSEKEFADAFAEATGDEPIDFGDPVEEVAEGEEAVNEEIETGDVEAIATGDSDSDGGDAGDNGETAEVADEPKEEEQEDKTDLTVEELQKQLAFLQHKERSSAGRVGAFKKQINALEAELSQRQTKLLDALKSDDPSFREDFPEIAEAMDRRTMMIAQELEQRMMARLQPYQQLEQQRYVESQYAELDSALPGWRQIVVGDQFKGWLANQPEQVQALAVSDKAADAASLIHFYASTTGAFGQQTQTQQQPAPSQNQANIQANRKKLEQAAGISTSSRKPTSNAIPDDFASAFDAFVKADERGR